METVAIDIGNWGTKSTRDGLRADILPSVIGPAVTIAFHNSLAEPRNGNDLTIEMDGQAWFVGELAIRQSPQPITLTARDRDARLLRLLMLAALYRLETPNDTGLQVVSGLPLAWYKEEDQEALTGALHGLHICRINGEHITWNVLQAAIVPQTFGTYCLATLTRNGEEVINEIDGLDLGIVDVGKLTTNLMRISKSEYIGHLSTSRDDLGMGMAYNLVAQAVAERFDLQLSPQRAELALREGFIRLAGKNQSIRDICDAALTALCDGIVAAMQNLWGKSKGRDLDRIIGTGGGIYLVGERLADVYPQLEPIRQAQTANCLGMYRLGRNLWRYR